MKGLGTIEAKREAKVRDPSLDWMRVASILYVTGFWHLVSYTGIARWYHAPVFYRVTVVALGIFVLISGMLVGTKAEISSQGLRRFYSRRLIRIYPLYLIAVWVFFAFGILGLKPNQRVEAGRLS